MSEELQNEVSIESNAGDIQQNTSTEANENPQGPDLATETQNEVKAEPTEAEKETKRQAAFNKQYGQVKQAERERDEARAEIERMQQANQPQQAPTVGDFPQEFDFDTTEDFESAKATFINNVQAGERYKNQQTSASNATQQQTDRAAQQHQEKINADSITYTENAKKNGISAQELQEAANSVISYGITEDLTLAIIADPDGPLLTKYLAANPLEVSNLINMNPYAAGAYMIDLKVKAAALKPKTSNTPSPTTDIQGNGASPAKHPALEGVTYS